MIRYKEIPGTGDQKMINYAYLLETLDAQLYLEMLMRLTVGGENNGAFLEGLNINPTEPDVFYIRQFAAVEKDHRDMLRALYHAQLPDSLQFNLHLQNTSRRQALETIANLERVISAAYIGAFPYLESPKLAPLFAAIQGTESRHAAVLNSVN